MSFLGEVILLCVLMLSAVVTAINIPWMFTGFSSLLLTMLFSAQAVAGICFTLKKMKYRKMTWGKSQRDVLMTALSSLLSLGVSFLFLRDISASFGSYIGDVGRFFLALIFIACPYLCVITFWITASVYEDEFNRVDFAKQLAASVVLIIAFCII